MHYSLSLVGNTIIVYHALARVLGNDKRLSGELPGYCGFGTFVELHPIIRWLAIHDRFQLGSLRMIPCAALYSWRLRSYRL